MQKSPAEITSQIQTWKQKPDQQYYDDIKVNPCLVKKNNYSSLSLPDSFKVPDENWIPTLRKDKIRTSVYFNQIEM